MKEETEYAHRFRITGMYWAMGKTESEARARLMEAIRKGEVVNEESLDTQGMRNKLLSEKEVHEDGY